VLLCRVSRINSEKICILKNAAAAKELVRIPNAVDPMSSRSHFRPLLLPLTAHRREILRLLECRVEIGSWGGGGMLNTAVIPVNNSTGSVACYVYIRTIKFPCFFRYYYQIIRRDRRVTPYPTKNTHRYSTANCLHYSSHIRIIILTMLWEEIQYKLI
jgi:hypothetical protein